MGRLVRSADKKIAGVCAGIAEHFGLNVASVRPLWFILTILGVGAPVLCYFILWFLMPDAGNQKESYAERLEKRLGNK